MFYPKGNLPYTATLSAFAVNACSTDSKLQVNWGGAVLNREPHLELGKIDPRNVEIVTSDAYRKQIVSSQGGEDIVSVTAPVNYFVGIPKEIALSAGQTVKDLQIFAFTEDKEMAEGLARAYIHAISLCGHKPGAAPASRHGAAASPTAREIERQALTALSAQEKDAETETARDAETYSTQVKVAQEKAAAEKAVRDAALAKAEQAVQAARAAQAERLRQWQAKVDGLTEQVRIAEQDAVDKEQIAGQADQLKQQADGLTDTSAANSGSMGTAGVLMGSLGSLWGSHTAKKNRDAAQKARAHANEMRAQLDAMGASQPPPVTESSLPPITPADTTNPIQDELNKGLNNINAAYAHDMALKQQQEQQQAQQQSQQSSSAAITSTSTSSEEDYCKGHHPVYHGCRGAISDAVARDNYCYCP
jgi:chemotaxis protein histidine kinase CheA